MKLFHGSDHIIDKPDIILGKFTNDYGRGFYCTENKESAKEWACRNNVNGFVNEYELDIEGLKVLNLIEGNYNIINWLALLLNNRTFSLRDEFAIYTRDYIISNYLIDISQYDIIIGYRADDSYFSYAQSFISNTLPLSSLNKALYLGELGSQIVLISQAAFDKIKFIKSEKINKDEYYERFLIKDKNAREAYKNEVSKNRNYKDEIFIMDIIREEMKNDDPRLQRIIFR